MRVLVLSAACFGGALLGVYVIVPVVEKTVALYRRYRPW